MSRAAIACVLALLPAPQRDREWQPAFSGSIIGISPEHAGDCFAILTTTELSVWTYDGRRLWRRSFARLSKVFEARSVSLAPTCDWAAVAGSESYRYVWIFTRGGEARHIAFNRETPVATAISPLGRLAVSTGMQRLHLFDGVPLRPALTVMKKRRVYAATQAFSDDGRWLRTTSGYGSAVLTADGETVWEERGGFCSLSAAASMDWSLSVCVPNHGPGGAWIVARDPKGKRLWEKDFPEADVGLLGFTDGGTVALLTRNPARIRWYSAAGREVRSEDLPDEFVRTDVRRNLTRLLVRDEYNQTLRVLSRTR